MAGRGMGLTSSHMGLADPDVVGRPEVRDIRDGALAVDLPHSLKPVLEVSAPLGAKVDRVDVKDRPPEETPGPRHLSHGEIVLRADEKVCGAQKPVLRQHRDGVVHGVHEGRDHGEGVGEGDKCGLVLWWLEGASIALHDKDILPPLCLDLGLGHLTEGVAEVHDVDCLELVEANVLSHHINILLMRLKGDRSSEAITEGPSEAVGYVIRA